MRSPPAPQTNFHNKSGFLSQSVTFQGNAASTFDKTRREYVVTEIRTKYREVGSNFSRALKTQISESYRKVCSLYWKISAHTETEQITDHKKRENQIEIKI